MLMFIRECEDTTESSISGNLEILRLYLKNELIYIKTDFK